MTNRAARWYGVISARNEAIGSILPTGAPIFLPRNRPRLGQLPLRPIPLAAFRRLLASLLPTLRAGFCWAEILGLLERVAYTISAARRALVEESEPGAYARPITCLPADADERG